MFLFLNAIITSLDGFVIGINLKFAKTKLKLYNYLVLIITNMIIYSTIIVIYYIFHFHFMTTLITTIFYLILAWNAYHDSNDQNYEHVLPLKHTILIAIAHSLDGGIVSLNFVYNYSLLKIILLFSLAASILLFIGYLFAHLFKNLKHSNIVSALLFIALAIYNYFF